MAAKLKSKATKADIKRHKRKLKDRKRIRPNPIPLRKGLTRAEINQKYYSVNRHSLLLKKSQKRQSNQCKRLGTQRLNLNFIQKKNECKKTIENRLSKEEGKKSSAKIEAKSLLEYAIQYRQSCVNELTNGLEKIKTYFDAAVSKINTCASIEDSFFLTFGQSKHTSCSEPYFNPYDWTNVHHETMVIDHLGRVHGLFPNEEKIPTKDEKVKESCKHWQWGCNPSFCSINKVEVQERFNEIANEVLKLSFANVRHFCKQLQDCTATGPHPNKLGHPLTCHQFNTCPNILLFLQRIGRHFPTARLLSDKFRALVLQDKNIMTVDEALISGDIEKLNELRKHCKSKPATVVLSEALKINEEELQRKHQVNLATLEKETSDLPVHSCLSCHKLCKRSDCTQLSRMKRVPCSEEWSRLIEEIKPLQGTELICNYCLHIFKDGKLPARCILNGMQASSVPEEIKCLNDFEKILIQRAKAFQTVANLQTVASAKIPPAARLKKVKGKTFHLPLPLTETLNSLNFSQEQNREQTSLIIMVHSLPTDKKIIWEQLVDVEKVFNALKKLKEIGNPLYADLQLPESAGDLVFGVHIEQCPPTQSSTETEGNPLLQKVRKENEGYHEHFSIQSLHNARPNELPQNLYKMVRVEGDPIYNETAQNLDAKCFPDLFPEGRFGQHHKRPENLKPSQYVKARLLSHHGQFRRNQQYLFYLQHDANIRAIRSGIFHKMRVLHPSSKLTARDLQILLNSDAMKENLETVFSRLRNTESFWKRPRSELNAMILNYGPATWFMTLSPGEWLWDDLKDYLIEMNKVDIDINKLQEMSTNALIALDPISSCRFMNNKFKAMLKFICSDSEPLGKVTHYFWRREYQGRGMQHFHMMLWIEDAPIIGRESAEDIAKFVTKYATCELPSEASHPILHERIRMFQIHHCNSYCLRSKQQVTGAKKVCRFGFPRAVHKDFKLNDVAESTAARKAMKTKNSRLYELPRKEEEKNINDYSPTVLLAWEGNMDMQYIGENSNIINYYCTKYTTKSEKSHTAEVLAEMSSCRSVSSRLWNFAMRQLTHRECGILETADSLIGSPLHATDPDTTVRWIDVNLNRARILKSKQAIDQLLDNDPDSTEIFAPSLVDTFYPNRPEQLEKCNLYDFSSKYDVQTNKPSKDVESYIMQLECGTRYIKKRGKDCIINHYHYKAESEAEKYFFSILLLFLPWRSVSDLKEAGETYAESYGRHSSASSSESGSLSREASSYSNKILEADKALQAMQEKVKDQMDQVEALEDDDVPENALPWAPTDIQEAMEEFHDQDQGIEPNLEDLVSKLNADQRRIFDKMKLALEGTTPTRLFVSGTGGTGKSFLINTLKSYVKTSLGQTAALLAPTGISAYNIGGMTIHRLLQLPIEHGKTPKYRPLTDEALEIVRKELKDVSLIIVDEISMVSSVTLLYMHLRLTDIFQTQDKEDGWFGGKHVVVFGDLLQLPPVFERPVYEALTGKEMQNFVGALSGIDLWRDLFSYEELIINMRQKSDPEFAAILDSVRTSTLKEKDIKMLQTRRVELQDDSSQVQNIANLIMTLPKETVCILPTRHMCNELNAAVMNEIEGDEVTLNAKDSLDCPKHLVQKVKELISKYENDSSRTAGLDSSIRLKLQSRVMLRRNIDVTKGLVNGAIGDLKEIVYDRVNPTEVHHLNIAFSDNEVEIHRVQTKFAILDNAFIYRKQFPISPAYAITVHKSQGLSLESAVIDVGNSVFTCGQTYVALSRVTTLAGLHIINFDPRQVKASPKAIAEYNRLRKEFRQDLPALASSSKRPKSIKDTDWCGNKRVRFDIRAQEPSDQQKRHSAPCFAPPRLFSNEDGVSCYANATLQAMLNVPSLKEISLMSTNDHLKALAYQHQMPSSQLMDSRPLRYFLSDRFVTGQQDAADFFHSLCTTDPRLEAMVSHTVSEETLCAACGCKSVNLQQHTICYSVIPPGHSCSLQEAIDKVSEWFDLPDRECEVCGEKQSRQRNEIQTCPPVFVMALQQDKNQMSNVNKANVAVKICQRKKKVKSAVRHHGVQRSSGHYTALVASKTKWTLFNDSVLPKEVRWPHGAKDIYLLFLV